MIARSSGPKCPKHWVPLLIDPRSLTLICPMCEQEWAAEVALYQATMLPETPTPEATEE